MAMWDGLTDSFSRKSDRLALNMTIYGQTVEANHALIYSRQLPLCVLYELTGYLHWMTIAMSCADITTTGIKQRICLERN